MANKKKNSNKTNIKKNDIKVLNSVEEEQNKIIENVNKIIDQLNLNYKSIKFNLKNKKNITRTILDLENLLANKEFSILKEKISKLSDLYNEEEIQKEELLETKKNKKEKEEKNEKKKFNFIEFFKNTRYPIYSRYKRIITEEVGKDRIKKLCFVSTILFLLLAASIIGFLMYFGIIPGVTSSTSTDSIFSILFFAIPLACLFVV